MLTTKNRFWSCFLLRLEKWLLAVQGTCFLSFWNGREEGRREEEDERGCVFWPFWVWERYTRYGWVWLVETWFPLVLNIIY